MPILISGSLAYDYIMDFPDSFKNHILPDQMHILNVCFVVDQLKKNFGGTAGNIAYTMKLLGGNPLILGTIGNDGNEYLHHLLAHGIAAENITQNKDTLTASAHITTDKDDNQITAFFAGANTRPADLPFPKNEKISFAIISPTHKDVMIRHAKECAERRIPFCFDPGQQITALSPQELMLLIGQAKFLVANDYEMKMIEEKTGWGETELLNHVQTTITTLGEKGSIIRTKDEYITIDPCPPESVEDPTGAGDAYRAGFFSAYANGLPLETCGRVGSVAAVYAIESYGTQNHSFTHDEFAKRYEQTYHETLRLPLN
ncbi:MAG: carbohydrate kinase family protein [Patescibacteria group bacterium]